MDIARIEAIETAAVADLTAAAPPAVVEAMGIATTWIAGAHCASVRAAPGSRELNHVHALGADGAPVADATLDAIAAWYAQRNGAYVVGIAPSADPGLARALSGRGFTATRAWSKFVHDAARADMPPATDLRLDGAAGDEFGSVVAQAFGFPPAMADWVAALPARPCWTCLAARDSDGTALGAGAMFVSEHGAWLGFGATLPAARGRGAQRALLARRVSLALELGCDLVTTETGVAMPGAPQQSHRNIERAGFRIAYERPHLASPGFPG